MRHLLLLPDRNTPPDNDYTGAFKPEALRCAKYWRSQGDDVVVHEIDVSAKRPERRAQALELIAKHGPINRLAFFCHGWSTGVQLGFEIGDGLSMLVASLAAHSPHVVKVALYCCSTGRSKGPVGDGGDGSFADRLRDGLVAAGKTASVFGHTAAGHTTQYPGVRFFLSDTTQGGVKLAEPATPEWDRLVARLRKSNDPLRWRLPYLSVAEARAEIDPT
jgi:hypothetical protein